MKRLVATLAVLGLFAWSSTGVFAQKKKPKAPTDASIVLNEDHPSLGETVTFSWSGEVPKGGQTSDLRIQLEAWKDGRIVWAEVSFANDQQFVLGEYDLTASGQPKLDGDVTCVATLYYFSYVGTQQYFNPLASTTFTASPVAR